LFFHLDHSRLEDTQQILHTAVCSVFQIQPTGGTPPPLFISTLPTQKLHRNWGFLSVTHF
ncbi:MAG TPA: hypothetical protein VJ023_10925, partial [Pyrinomonadaceae bacterium]|nr:hypothetical protein [Pyrinomonadaceae bacterium]